MRLIHALSINRQVIGQDEAWGSSILFSRISGVSWRVLFGDDHQNLHSSSPEERAHFHIKPFLTQEVTH